MPWIKDYSSLMNLGLRRDNKAGIVIELCCGQAVAEGLPLPAGYRHFGGKFMKKMAGAAFSTGLMISAITGFLHFFVPYVFKWYGYIPDAPKEIFAAIDYVNFFISLLLFGLSAILLMMKKKIFAGSGELFIFYAFLVFTWLCRVIITLVVPWPSSLQTWLIAGFSAEFALTLLPAVYLLGSKTIQVRKECR